MNDLLLVGDVGGTNARFALVESPATTPTRVEILKNDEFPSLAAAIRTYLEDQGAARPTRAAIDIAGPVTGDHVKLTNRGWDFSIEEVRQELGLAELIILNDFEALALACPFLPEDASEPVGVPGMPVPGKPMAVLGPGTGLGVAGVVPGRGRWIPVPGEGGHVEISTAIPRLRPALEVAYQGRARVSAEHWMCGPGLVRMGADLAEAEGRAMPWTSPPEIEVAAHGGDAFACELIGLFLDQLASLAGDVALTFGARGGVYLGGGVLDHLSEFLDADRFATRFRDKGRLSSFLEGVPLRRITAPTPALFGCTAKLLHG
ncbi:MAG TPA: glucokinase [Geminicoccus sp.]|uniref:glucokinase n=1 Tax=Geminicoccus sp. TaxID=2024832 RepID=UPI002E365A74|nr:glucokinase [Geminicoccus sp.]HEX2528618.1 glucokinase [Geminicoccus sp.]